MGSYHVGLWFEQSEQIKSSRRHWCQIRNCCRDWHLRKIDQLRGDADLSDILPYYEQWYVAARKRFTNHPNQALAGPYFNRHRAHILKLAVIYEASRSVSLPPSEASWKRAEHAASWLEETIFSLLSTGMNSEGFALKKIEERIQSAGVDGVALSELTRASQHEGPRRRLMRLATLKAADTIFTFYRRTPGRGATILVGRPGHSLSANSPFHVGVSPADGTSRSA